MREPDSAIERFAALDEAALGRPWSFLDRPAEVRYALYRTLEEEQEIGVRLGAQPHPESRRILSLAQRGFRRLDKGYVEGYPSRCRTALHGPSFSTREARPWLDCR